MELCKHCLKTIVKRPNLLNEEGRVVIRMPFIHFANRLRVCKGTPEIHVATPMNDEDVVERVFVKYHFDDELLPA